MATKKVFKRIFITLGVILLLVIGAAVAIPYFFKDELVAAIKDSVNETMNATVDFKDADISILRSFPNLTLTLNDLSVIGQGEFKDLALYKAKETALTIDIKSAMNAKDGPISVKKIRLDQPQINILVLPQGKANYDVTKETEAKENTETKFNMDLEAYEINDGHFVYDDRSINYFMEMEHLNHSGKGHFTESVFDLVTESKMDALTLKYGGMAYLSKVKTHLDATFNIDTKNSKYTLKDNDLTLNNLKILADGFIQLLPKDVMKMDMTFKAPGNQFKDLLSILPAAYVKDFDQVKSSGSFALNGFIKGDMGPDDEFPAMKFDIDIKNGNVQYPDLPMGISGINLKTKIKKSQGDLNKLVVDIPTFRMKVGKDPIEGHLRLSNAMVDPNIDTKIKGIINLANFAKAWPMEGVKSMSGIINADIVLKAALSQLENGDYENVNMDGLMSIKEMVYDADDMPKVQIRQANMSFSPKYVDVPDFDMRLGKSDLKGSARIDNILAYISPKKTMKGTMNITSNNFDVNEWMSTEETPATASVESTEEKPFDRFDFDMVAKMGTITYDAYTLKNFVFKGHATSQKAKINNLSMNIGDSDLAGKGELTNLFGYLFGNQTLRGDLFLTSNYLNVNQFMEEPAKGGQTNDAPTESSVFLVPDNMDININGKFKKVKYEDYLLTGVDGDIKMADNKMVFNDFVAGFLGGKMALDGEYNTQDNTSPKFDFNYALQQMKFKKIYAAMVTFQKLAPVAKFIDGIFNTKLHLNGVLGEDMMPDLSSLTASGLIETLSGKVNGLQPLEKLASTLNVNAVKKLSLKDTKNWFDIEDGKLTLKPFDINYQGIDMNVMGFSKFDGGMNVDMKLKIPRKMMESNAAGAAAGKGMDWVRGQASKLGVNIKKSKYINVKVNMLGKIDNPKLKVKLLGGSGESLEETAKSSAKDIAKKAEDSLRNVATKKLDDAKAKAQAEADKRIADAKAKAKAEAEKAAKKAKDEIVKKAGEEVGGAVKDKAKDILDKAGAGDKADDVIDKGKDALGKWNPFKKKKKN